MPELTAIHIGLLALALVVGVALGWIFRGERSAKEKIAINAGWQDQLESQQAEQDRLAEQNTGLMEQISQYQASHKDSINRAKELSDSLKESFQRRDEMKTHLNDFRKKLELTIAQRDKLKDAVENREIQAKSSTGELKEKDDKIFHLSRELTSWQSRVPPLVEKFQLRDKQARELEEELEKARARIESFEEMARSNQTRIEPIDAGGLPDGLDASNEPHSDTSTHAVSVLQDQIDDDATLEEGVEPVENLTSSDDELLAADKFVDEEDRTADDEPDVETQEVPDSIETFTALADELLAADTFVDGKDKSADEPGPDTQKSNDDLLSGEPESGGDKDDLKQIKGVGPAIEKTLNDLGIFLFNQLAEISEQEIDRVAQRLKGFRSRIYREDWIGQARDLHYQKNNNSS